MFGAWLGGAFVGGMIREFFVSARLFRAGAAQLDWDPQVISAISLIAVSAWHAWLLFRGSWIRFALWAIMPVILLFFPVTQGFYTGFLLFPVLELALLANVRGGLGFWLLARYIGLPLVLVGAYAVTVTIGIPISNFLVGHLTDVVGLPAGTMLGFVRAGSAISPQLVCDALLAATLAWKMPAIKPSQARSQTIVDQPVAN